MCAAAIAGDGPPTCRASRLNLTSRRRFLAGTAAAAALAGAPALSAEPPVDPALDAIARHRQAFADLLAAIRFVPDNPLRPQPPTPRRPTTSGRVVSLNRRR
ncbi:twin-arginine translocation signal domain-containing protein [Bradyrhizobium sp. 27S5]|uniref:twin-arginine translocation signal domain-containing protein n=1 Tax=Bradyrhizobium sp. 27S5 TaxID=3139728 RepID=UPI0039C8A68E